MSSSYVHLDASDIWTYHSNYPRLKETLLLVVEKFILSLSDEDCANPVKLLFQLQEAHWYYLDTEYERQGRRRLPKLGLGSFIELVFHAYEPLQRLYPTHRKREAMWASWKKFRDTIPVRGAIMVDPSLEFVAMVTPYEQRKSTKPQAATWMFPRGKKNAGTETDADCAAREVEEETGYWPEIDASLYIDHKDKASGQHARMYVIFDVPLTTQFRPRASKEIGQIAWLPLDWLPGWPNGRKQQARFLLVDVFVPQLHDMVRKRRREAGGRRRGRRASRAGVVTSDGEASAAEQRTTSAISVFVGQQHMNASDSDGGGFATGKETSDVEPAMNRRFVQEFNAVGFKVNSTMNAGMKTSGSFNQRMEPSKTTFHLDRQRLHAVWNKERP